MYATVRRYEDVTDPAEAGRRVAEGFLPLVRQIPGFVAYYWVDAGDGVMASTSVFEDRAGAQASTERAADWVRENIASLLPNPPLMTAGEVVASGPVDDIVGDSPSVQFDVSDPVAATAALQAAGVRTVTGESNGTLVVDLDGTPRAEAVAALVRAGVGVDRVVPRRRLEDAFLALVRGDTEGSADR